MNKKNNTFLHGLASRFSALVLLLVAGTVSAMALGTNKLEVSDLVIKPGETKTISVSLTNDDPVSALQFDVDFPTGLSYVPGSLTLSSERTTEQKHTVSGQEEGANYDLRVLLLTHMTVNRKNSALTGNEGEVLTFDVKAASDFVPGEIVFSNIVGTDGTCEIEPKPYEIPMADFKVKAYPQVGLVMVAEPEMTMKAGDEAWVNVVLKNDVNIVGLQADFTLPAGISLVTVGEGDEMTYVVEKNTERLTYNVGVGINAPYPAEPNRYRLVMASLTNDLVKGTDGVIFSIKIKADDDFAETGKIEFDDVLVSMPSSSSDYVVYASEEENVYPVVTINPYVAFELTQVTPANDEAVESLSKVEFKLNVDVTAVAEGAKVEVYNTADDKVAEGTLALVDGVLTATFATPIDVYGTYNVVIPAGALIAGRVSNAETLSVEYKVGFLTKDGALPSEDDVLESLSSVTVFMNANVGGLNDEAKLEVYRNGGKVGEATLSESTVEPYPFSNEVVINLDHEITEYGTYVIKVPAGVIYDAVPSADDVDPGMSVNRSNVEFELTYKVGKLNKLDAIPSEEKAVESLKEITVIMNARVGGIEGDIKCNVMKDGKVVTTALLEEGIEPNSNEVILTLADEITEYGTYEIVVPEGVIWDDNCKVGEDGIIVDPIYSGARSNVAFTLVYNVGLFELESVDPEDGATLESLSEIKLKVTNPVGGIFDGAKVTVKRNGEDAVIATLSVNEEDATEVVVTLAAEQKEYGLYTIEIPADVIFDEKYDEVDPLMSGARSLDLIALNYHVGEFTVANVDPLPGAHLDSLRSVTIFMSAPVGGFLASDAQAYVMKGEEMVTTATLDWATEPGGNDVAVWLDEAISAYGTYTIVVPKNTIFDVNYSGDDAAFSGALSNAEDITLTYTVGEFKVDNIAPNNEEPVSSLKDIELFMSGRVGGFDEAAKVTVEKNGDVVAEGTLDWATEPYGNDVAIRLNTELTEYGVYVVKVPAGVIFDENYSDDLDPAMGGSASNEALELVYQVGEFNIVKVTPSTDYAVLSLQNIELFMSARVGGFLDGATVTVTNVKGEEVTTGTLDWATEPLGNDVLLHLEDEITEFGVYNITIPEGVIFDENYDEVDPYMSGSRSNEAVTLTYTVGLSLEGDFVPVSVTPSPTKVLESLSEIDIVMNDTIGGFLIGSPVVVTDATGAEVARGSFEWADEANSNEIVIRLNTVIEEAGTYTVTVPEGVIYDKNYNDSDPFMPGVNHNEGFVLTYTVSGASSINGVKMDINSTDKVYNLNGVRVNGPIGKGLYIINGKKVVNKK